MSKTKERKVSFSECAEAKCTSYLNEEESLSICEASFQKVCLLAIFGSRFIVQSYRTHRYEHLEQKYLTSPIIYQDMAY